MARRGGYKGLASSCKSRATTSATRGIYNLLGGKSGDKRIGRKNPTTKNLMGLGK